MGRRRPCSSLRERAIEREASRGGPEDREEGSATCGAPAARSTGRRGGVEVLVLLCTASMQRNRRQSEAGMARRSSGPGMLVRWPSGNDAGEGDARAGAGTPAAWFRRVRRRPADRRPRRGKFREEQQGKERRHGERRHDLVAAAACRRRAGRTGQARGGRGSAGRREEAHGCWWRWCSCGVHGDGQRT